MYAKFVLETEEEYIVSYLPVLGWQDLNHKDMQYSPMRVGLVPAKDYTDDAGYLYSVYSNMIEESFGKMVSYISDERIYDDVLEISEETEKVSTIYQY